MNAPISTASEGGTSLTKFWRWLLPRHEPASRKIPSLDGIRGMAVLFVLLDHLSDAGLHLFGNITLNRIGTFGVFLFFSLSAFLLTFQFWMRPAAELLRPAVWAEYAFRRFLRIFPLYALVLFVTVWRSGDLDWRDLRDHLLLLDAQRHFWTIMVEVKYYMVLPALLIAAAWVERRRKWAGVLGAGAVLVGLTLLLPPLELAWNPNQRLWLHRYLWIFVAGSLAGIAHAITINRKLDLRRFAWVFEFLAIAALFVVLMRVRGLNSLLPAPLSKGWDVFKHTEVCAVAWAVLLFSHLHGVGILRRIFSFRLLRCVGFISYSIYLWHRLIEDWVKGRHLPEGQTILAFVSAAFAVATVSYFVVERPLSRLRLRAAPKSPTASATA